MKLVIFGLTITSSWGNGHATTYRALSKGLQQRGHTVTFLERDVPWYRAHRDLPHPPYCRTELYGDLREVSARYTRLVSSADLVMIGSYVPNGALLADWITMHAKGVTAFYDIDTPITLARLEEGNAEYITAALIPRFDLYLSFNLSLQPCFSTETILTTDNSQCALQTHFILHVNYTSFQCS